MEILVDDLLWNYLSKGQRDLIEQGRYMMKNVVEDSKFTFSDYSFVVFPFAKAYEGFLKQILLDLKFIDERDYVSDHFRIGKVLSPNLVRKLGNKSVYKKICDSVGCDLSDEIWDTWKIGRNQVFHYFPHNLKSLSLQEAQDIIENILMTMDTVVKKLKIQKVKNRLVDLSELKNIQTSNQTV